MLKLILHTICKVGEEAVITVGSVRVCTFAFAVGGGASGRGLGREGGALMSGICACINGTPLQYSCLENPMDGGA